MISNSKDIFKNVFYLVWSWWNDFKYKLNISWRVYDFSMKQTSFFGFFGFRFLLTAIFHYSSIKSNWNVGFNKPVLGCTMKSSLQKRQLKTSVLPKPLMLLMPPTYLECPSNLHMLHHLNWKFIHFNIPILF